MLRAQASSAWPVEALVAFPTQQVAEPEPLWEGPGPAPNCAGSPTPHSCHYYGRRAAGPASACA